MTFLIHILGSGAAIPLTHRNPSAQIVNVNSKLYLFDCAEGTQVQIRRNRIRLQKIDHIFITHLHGDHYFGLMGLITTMHLLGREDELNVYAPQALEQIIHLHLEVSKTILRYPLHFHPVDTEASKVILENKDVLVSSIPMVHNFPTCGYLIREQQAKPNIRKEFLEGKELSNADFRIIKDGEDYVDDQGQVLLNADITRPPKPPRAYAYCTDTAYSEAIISQIAGVDLLYHEATFMEDKRKDAEAKFHSTAAQAATIAQKANVKKLLLGHYSARYTDLDGLLEEAKAVFPESYLTVDGLIIEV
jgi:ribonuclease Z